MWVLPEIYADRALALATDWGRAGVQKIAPCFMPAEVANAIYKRVRRHEMTFSQAQEALDIVLSAGVGLADDPEMHRRALVLAQELGQATTYDAHYLALAELRGCDFWTGDERLYRAVHGRLPWVRWVGSDDVG
jgi:predicted nucleic acid-binding protein